MKVFLITYSFPPVNAPAAQRPYYFSKYLPEHGVKTVVLTTHNSISSIGKSDWALDKDIELYYTDKPIKKASTLQGVVKSKKSLIHKILGQLLIPDRAIVWLPKALYYGYKILKADKQITHIFATSPSFVNNIVAVILNSFFGKKVIIDIRDFYFHLGREEWRVWPLKLIDQAIERTTLAKATQVTFVSESMLHEYQKHYPFIIGKTHLIYNGFNLDEFVQAESEVPNQSSGKLRFFYAGSFYGGERSPFHFFKLIDELIKNQVLSITQFEILIAGPIESEMIEQSKNYNCFSAICFLGIIPRKQAIFYMLHSDFLLLLIGNIKGHYLTLPVKLFEYLAAKKQIILFSPKEAEARTILTRFEVGICLENNMEKIHDNYQILERAILNHHTTKEGVTTPTMQQLAIFDRKFQAQQLFKIITA